MKYITCNRNLPRNAINGLDIKAGMYLSTFSDPKVREVACFRHRVNDTFVQYTDGHSITIAHWGTARRHGVPEYNYHEGHDCGL